MSNFFQKAEQAAESFEGQGNNNSSANNQQYGNNQQDNNNQQYGNNQQDSNNQQGNYQQDSNNNNQREERSSNSRTQNQGSSSSGGFMGGAMQAGEDGAINTEMNQFMTKEGVPSGMDGAVDAFVDKEANQYLGGNKNF